MCSHGLFIYGGVTNVAATQDAVCAVDLKTGSAGAYTSYRPVVKAVDMRMDVKVVASHPHLEDIWYFGGSGNPNCDGCKPPGVFALQRRRSWNAAKNTYVWAWGSVRVADDDFAFRDVRDLDLGPGTGGPTAPITTLYVTGGSWWDGAASW